MEASLIVAIGAALLSAYLSLRSVRAAVYGIESSKQLHQDRLLQEKHREVRQRKTEEARRLARTYEVLIVVPMREYLGTLIATAHPLLENGIANLEAAAPENLPAAVRDFNAAFREELRRIRWSFQMGTRCSGNHDLVTRTSELFHQLEDQVSVHVAAWALEVEKPPLTIEDFRFAFDEHGMLLVELVASEDPLVRHLQVEAPALLPPSPDRSLQG